jgi:hypothetical protein
MYTKLLSYQNAKASKSIEYGYLNFILYLAPHTLSGWNVCAGSSPECREDCLYGSGFGKFENVQKSRIAKTKRYFVDRENFLSDLRKDILRGIKYSKSENLIPCIRLDGTSDLFLAKHFVDLYKQAVFYDYTKVYNRFSKIVDLENYHLTYSYSGRNKSNCLKVLASGKNVAVAFKNCLPETLWNYPVIDGDKNDLRFLDPKGCIVGLTPKGQGIKSVDSSFFIDGLSAE